MTDYIANGDTLHFDEVERLIIEQAFVNAVGADVKTKDPSNLRGRVDEMMKEAYYSNPMAARSFDLKLGGEKVGTYSLTVSKPKKSSKRLDFEIDDRGEFMEWAVENGYTETVVDWDAILADFKATGTVPEGCSIIEVIEPEEVGGEITRTTVKVDSAKVAQVMGPRLGAVAAKLLEGGDDAR